MALLSLVAKLGLDSTGFQQGINKASKQASQFGSSLKTTLAGAFGAGAMIAFAKGIAETTNRIKDLSEQFGVSTDDVQNIDYAMKQSGLSFEDFAAAMTKMGPARREAALGNEELAATFQKFGVTAEDLQNPLLSNKDILMKVADAMRGTNVTAADQAAIMDLLGPKAAKMANVLAGLDGFQAPSLFSEDDINNIDQITKELEVFWRDVQIGAVESTKSIMDWGKDIYAFLSTLFDELSTRWKDVLNPFKSGQTISDSINKALEESGKQAAARDEQRANEKEQRDKDRQEAAKKREEELKKGGDLFKKPVKEEKAQQEPMRAVESLKQGDQLGRIGAFSGGASNNVVEQVKKTTATLVEIKRVLEFKGIVVKDL